MTNYICKKCGDLICETSTCPNCGSRAELNESCIYWCNICEAPSYNKECACCGSECAFIGTDLRPVFPKERLLLETLIGEPFKYKNSSVWNVGSNNYIVDGKKKSFPYSKLISENPPDTIISSLQKNENLNLEIENHYLESKHIQQFIKVNKMHLNSITFEAINYIRTVSENKNESEMFVSFSGGKDSTVTSDLVLNALDKNIIHIYGDTTLEYPTSEIYVKRFRNNHPSIPLLVAKNKDQDFNNLCEVIGPPSRMSRWCCTIFKTGAISKKIESTFKDAKQIIAFQGIRRNESNSRNKYDRESNESKIGKQIAINPIIDWTDFDVWLYILSNKIDFNDAYKQGFTRVGCWCCPNNSIWSGYLSSIYMNEEYNKFYDILYRFAKKIGKPDWKKYIDDGEWKKRQGGNGLEAAKSTVISFKPCVLEENTYNFDLTKKIDENLYTFFKPFGILNYDIGKKMLNEVYVLSRKDNNPILRITGRIGTEIVKVSIVGDSPYFKQKKLAESYIKSQINKFQTCLGCTYCEAICKHGAIKVFNRNKGDVSTETISYSIDESKCIGCLECVNHFTNGCYLNKVLRTKETNL